VNSREKLTSWRVWIPALLFGLAAALVSLWPSPGGAFIQPVPEAAQQSATNSVEGGIESWLVERGLMRRSMIGAKSGSDEPTPPPGVEVDETQQTVSKTGELLMRTTSWNEAVGDDLVHIEVTTLPSHQYEVGFWLFPIHQRGCAMFGWTLYDHGRPLKSTFWRNDPALRLAGAADLPDDLYPDALPGMAFLRALDAPRYGSAGELHQQLTPYSYVGQGLMATGPEQVHVVAGNFTALKVTAQADIGTLMPN
jgi:hypothetical protein